MAKLGTWSTTAGSNNATPPDGWPEGQAPSTVNDCAREMMASIRTVFNDAQFFDQGFTPTYVNATSFTVTGDQTSAIHAGRRLKLYDATAGVATILYATVLTASYTFVTTISVSCDAGQLTNSLTSFAISILSNTNSSLPRNAFQDRFSTSALEATVITAGATTLLATLSVSGATVLSGALSVGGAATLGTTLSVSGQATLKSVLSVGGAATFASTLSVSGTVVAANVAKGWVFFVLTAGGASVLSSFNVASVSRSAMGVFRVNFSTAFADNNICALGSAAKESTVIAGLASASATTTTFKGSLRDGTGAAVEDLRVQLVFYR